MGSQVKAGDEGIAVVHVVKEANDNNSIQMIGIVSNESNICLNDSIEATAGATFALRRLRPTMHPLAWSSRDGSYDGARLIAIHRPCISRSDEGAAQWRR